MRRNGHQQAKQHRLWIIVYTFLWAYGRRTLIGQVEAASRDANLPSFDSVGVTTDALLEGSLSIRAGSTPQPTSLANKKYTQAATSAMETINSLMTSKTRQPNLPNLSSESALMDKETNAIYWQGGAKILSTSLTMPYLTERGVLHVKATILTSALWLWVWGKLSRHLASRYFESDSVDSQGSRLFFSLPFISPDGKAASFLTPIIHFFLLLFHSLLYLRLPRYSPKVITVTILLYLLEAFTCSTRRYLSHALNAPADVEAYLERIRNVEPSVEWKVRCFHYEDREFWKSSLGLRNVWDGLTRKGEDRGSDANNKGSANANANVESPPSWLARKVVTHQAVGTYKFGSCEDRTLASIWKRSQSFDEKEAPFSKLSLSKLLVLKDKATREDYFAQQAAFVMEEGRKDVHAEFATSISVEGFRSKLLAVRPVQRVGLSHISAALFRQSIYIIFTLLGLSLPFRIWFAKHCDEIRVTVMKETSSRKSSSSTVEAGVAEGKSSSWFRGKWGRGSSSSSFASTAASSKKAQELSEELFRKNMQSYSLFEDEPSSDAAGETAKPVQDSPHPAEPSAVLTEVSPDENHRDESANDEATMTENPTQASEPAVSGTPTESKKVDAAPPEPTQVSPPVALPLSMQQTRPEPPPG